MGAMGRSTIAGAMSAQPIRPIDLRAYSATGDGIVFGE
jgi:hypothetical protein